MRTAAFLVSALAVAAAFLAMAPTAEAANGCTVEDPTCPAIVCYGTGDWHGYKVCIGERHPPCDPAACPPPA